MPSVVASVEAQDRAATAIELNDLAFALAIYHADRGSYPATLADLVPKYIATVPKDIFGHDAELHYARQGDGYLLYSVGSNGKDDGGKTYGDRASPSYGPGDYDDIVVRVPAKP